MGWEWNTRIPSNTMHSHLNGVPKSEQSLHTTEGSIQPAISIESKFGSYVYLENKAVCSLLLFGTKAF